MAGFNFIRHPFAFPSWIPTVQPGRIVGHAAEDNYTEENIGVDEMCSSADPFVRSFYGDKGNRELSVGNYRAALYSYSIALSCFDSNRVDCNSELSILLRNMSECHLQLGNIDNAYRTAKDSLKYNHSCNKAQLMLGDVCAAKNEHQKAFKMYSRVLSNYSRCNSHPRGMDESMESIEADILKKCCIHYMHLDKSKYPNNFHRILGIDIMCNVWIDVLYSFMVEKNIRAAMFVENMIQYTARKPCVFVMKRFNLRPLCDMNFIQSYPQCVSHISFFVSLGSNYTELSTEEGDTFIHAAVKMALTSGEIGVLRFICDEIKIEKHPPNLLDCSGNTALHLATKQRTEYCISIWIFDVVVKMLLEVGIDPFAKNIDGKIAFELLLQDDKKSKRILQKYNASVIEPLEVQCKEKRCVQRDHVIDLQGGKKKEKDKPNLGRERSVQKEQLIGQKGTKKIEKDEPDLEREPDQTHMHEDKCHECLAKFTTCQNSILEDSTTSLVELSRLIKSKHKGPRHRDIIENSIKLITDFLAESTVCEIPPELCRISQKLFKRVIDELKNQQKWLQVCNLALKHSKLHGDNLYSGFAAGIPLDSVLYLLTEKNLSRNTKEIIDWFFQNGGSVADGGRKCIRIVTERKYYQLIETLVCSHECDPQHLSLYSGDTPIHAVLDIAVKMDQDNISVFKKCMELYDKNSIRYEYLDPGQRDKNGDTLFHLIAKHNLNKTTQRLADILQKMQVRCEIQNKEGKYPHDYVKVDDPRSKIFQEAIEYETNALKSQTLCNTPNIPKTQSASVVTNLIAKPVRKKSDTSDFSEINPSNEKEANDKPVEAKPDIEIKEDPEIQESNLTQIIQMIKSLESKQKPKVEKDDQDKTERGLTTESGHGDDCVIEDVNLDDTQFEITRGMFEDPVWEMQYTYDFRKCMRDTHIMPGIKKRIKETIKSLVSGQWTNVLCKKLHTRSKIIGLYEAKLSKGSRLLWEVAIAFSPRLTTENNPLYTQVIILWDVVMEHKNIHQSVERIVKSYEKGSKSLIQKKIQINNNTFDNTYVKHPIIYEPAREDSAPCQIITLYPPANSNDNEYTTIKFYTFSSNVAFSILHERKGEFPFRVTDLEYHIINLPFTAPVVVIGRSGTGKTTCCIYRLWYRFQQYWSIHNLDNKTLKDVEIVENSERHKEETPFDDVEIMHPSEDRHRVVTCIQDPTMQFREEKTEEVRSMISSDTFTNGNTNGMSAVKDSTNFGAIEYMTDQVDSETLEKVEHHLRQVFITKNGVLCSEVRKSFRGFMIGDGITAAHWILEDTDLPNRLQDLSDKQYPLFVTAKYFWLMFDATLGAPYYFDRNPDDGSLKADIKGWTDVDDISILLCMEEEDYDSDSTDENENSNTEHKSQSERISQKKKRKPDPRREVTYNVFEELLWPQMIGKTKVHKNRYHPLLIWTEIMSFIKGSFEALASEKDYLSKAEYFEMGRKQAPAFVDDRETLYELFLIYEHMRRQKCLFDQTDVVKNLYRRFMKQKRRKWIVHEIYVDEAQDFTQSELYLLINLCESPNGMFLTGDTAQSIMKGVSFRFKDLVSLFHHTSKNLTMKAVDVSTILKRVHNLPHNYRSHSGITELAKSVLDILADLFSDSFDKLPDEQCVFNGPKPVILYAYSPDDLIKMLCQHKQDTSQIEFGAHQAILVVDDDARDKVPEELKTGIVLTLYEAKGLEFDDILLFNIFKNSQASKEWRVVTDFLQRHTADKTLQTEYSSRPLTFDQKLHKVLNSELKQLYTAITRARVNVWIFDEDVEKRTPMFQYFTALDLVKTSTERNFTVQSTPAEWMSSGEKLMKRELYDQAAQCFKMAGCIYK
ncbi:TPR and ankyrin repeat-containing protein 1-like isoform X3 [Mytilus californianus]|uniref:TPR and ankyrin repeat-containing protein 1-like isoform X3 n=1 Tax=Mytilus californianus TaxID=6549 RepID=UPI0022473E1D|nr:TPR and ankyrin repeat-containing protein 1-like isoform X3 [Mytilus californianus]